MVRIINKFKYLLADLIIPSIHILSDSHGIYFQKYNFRNFLNKWMRPKFCIIYGATASGIQNPNSKSKSNQFFYSHINNKIKKKDYVMFELGEVDCGFAIWYNSEKRQITVKEQFNYALENYFKLINDASFKVNKKIIVCSAIPPTIQDNTFWGEVANKRKDVKANLVERTQLTMEFNLSLKNFCDKNKYIFLDFDSFLIDPQKQSIKNKFLNKDKTDHHLDTQMFLDGFDKYIKSSILSP